MCLVWWLSAIRNHSCQTKIETPLLCPALLRAACGPEPDGLFIVRRRAEGGFVLSVWFRNKPTHHLIAEHPVTKLYVINNTAYGDCYSLGEVCEEEFGPELKSYMPGSRLFVFFMLLSTLFFSIASPFNTSSLSFLSPSPCDHDDDWITKE